jgi:hypothetical protein
MPDGLTRKNDASYLTVRCSDPRNVARKLCNVMSAMYTRSRHWANGIAIDEVATIGRGSTAEQQPRRLRRRSSLVLDPHRPPALAVP